MRRSGPIIRAAVSMSREHGRRFGSDRCAEDDPKKGVSTKDSPVARRDSQRLESLDPAMFEIVEGIFAQIEAITRQRATASNSHSPPEEECVLPPAASYKNMKVDEFWAVCSGPACHESVNLNEDRASLVAALSAESWVMRDRGAVTLCPKHRDSAASTEGGIKKSTRYFFRCNGEGCRRVTDDDSMAPMDTADVTRLAATSRGWRFTGSRALCPHHAIARHGPEAHGGTVVRSEGRDEHHSCGCITTKLDSRTFQYTTNCATRKSALDALK